MRFRLISATVLSAGILANTAPAAPAAPAQRSTLEARESSGERVTRTASPKVSGNAAINRPPRSFDEIAGDESRINAETKTLQSSIGATSCNAETNSAINAVESRAKAMLMEKGPYYGAIVNGTTTSSDELKRTLSKWSARIGEIDSEIAKVKEERSAVARKEEAAQEGEDYSAGTLGRLRKNADERLTTLAETRKKLLAMIENLKEAIQRNGSKAAIAERLQESVRVEAVFYEVLYASMRARVALICADDGEIPETNGPRGL